MNAPSKFLYNLFLNKLIDFFLLEGSLILLNLFLQYRLFNEIEKEEIYQRYWTAIINIQHADISYDSVNFDDPISTISYFKKIYRPYSHVPDETVDQWFNIMADTFTKGGPKKSAEVQAQNIMRRAAKKVHNAFRELESKSCADTADLVFDVMLEADIRLLSLMRECLFGDEDPTSKHRPVDS